MSLFTNQDNFNKLVTFVLMVYFMVMYAISFITGKPLDLTGVLSFLAPVVTHTSHLVYNSISIKNGGQK